MLLIQFDPANDPSRARVESGITESLEITQ